MMFRLAILMVVVISVGSLWPDAAMFGLGPPCAWAATLRNTDLRDKLEKGLKVRRPSEFAFVDRVVRLVEQRTLPVKLVESTFDWARRRRPYPFIYFQEALKRRAAKLGITL